MRPVAYDSGIRYDDVNLRWGDPSYLLEPGDPGWVYDPNSASQPTTTHNHKPRKKHMPKSDYIKRRDAEFAAQLLQFKNNVAPCAATLGLTTAQIDAQADDADYYNYVFTVQDICSQCAQQWSAWKEAMREGGGGAGTPPATPALPPAVTAVAPGIEGRFRKLVQIIKKHPAYNTAMGEVLGIEGPAQSGPDFAEIKPQISLELVGGQVVVRWSWLGFRDFLDMIEIQVDRGQGWQLLAYDTTAPSYTDTAPLPATAAVWKYRAIYRVGDQRVGQWSDEVSITVAA